MDTGERVGAKTLTMMEYLKERDGQIGGPPTRDPKEAPIPFQQEEIILDKAIREIRQLLATLEDMKLTLRMKNMELLPIRTTERVRPEEAPEATPPGRYVKRFRAGRPLQEVTDVPATPKRQEVAMPSD